jgi:DNA-binding CsgD family transcriptional regulator
MVNFEQLVDRIYQAPAGPDIWPSVLYEMSQSVQADGGALITRRNDSWVGWSLSPDVPAIAHDYLKSEAAARSQTTARLISANHAGFLTDTDLFIEEEYRADPFVTDFFEVAGLHHAAATAIIVPNADFLVFQVQRRTGAKPFAPADIAQLDALRPHLARAGMLAARWRLERLTAATAALELVDLPAAVLDLRGSVLAANGLIEGLESTVEWLPGNRIALADQTANILLQQAIADLSHPARASVRSVPIRAKGACEAAIGHVIPATGAARDFFGGGFGILVITRLSAPAPLDIGLLQGLFDLTASEARLASRIAEGLTLDHIAARTAISYETVRSQLKAVFAKTGAKRQSELAALLARLPLMKKR